MHRTSYLFIGSTVIQSLTAATVLIDGSTRNGSFSTLVDPSFDDGDVTFAETADWTNLGTGVQTSQAVRNAPAALDSAGDYPGASGSYNAVVPDNDTRIFANDTGHTVSPGDTFNLAYHWIDAFNWDDASDEIAVRFYTTADNLILGAEQDSFEILSGTSTVNAAYQQFSQTGISLPASFNGDRLFVAFYGVDGNAAANAFARVDDFSLTVIPEPATGLLASLAALALLRRKR